MLFELMNAPVSFQHTIDIILSRFKCKSFLVYLDAEIEIQKSLMTHMTHVHEVFSALRNFGLSLELYKCMLFPKTVDYLSLVVRPGKLMIA